MKKKIAVIFLIIIVISLPFFPTIKRKVEWKMAAEAASELSYQIGLTSVVVVPCEVTTTVPPVCVGGTLCYVKNADPKKGGADSVTCPLYSDVSGVPAGGMGSNALFLNTALAQAGVTTGGQLIAGGVLPTNMDQGVLGGPGGCSGCIAAAENKNFFAKAKDFVIAVFK